jgi:glycosyltransferase involved in cell wall biosynthesis
LISNQKPDFELDCLEFRYWNKKTETADLLAMQIGIMPLPDDPWTQGKCGFKALQYMTLAIPTLASPVGVNTQIIEDGQEGFLCRKAEEWEEKLIFLIENPALRLQMGEKAKAKVEKGFSVSSNKANFLGLFI